jgi:hypothetical protein
LIKPIPFLCGSKDLLEINLSRFEDTEAIGNFSLWLSLNTSQTSWCPPYIICKISVQASGYPTLSQLNVGYARKSRFSKISKNRKKKVRVFPWTY